MKIRWTQKEIDILKNNYINKHQPDLLILLNNRTWNAIRLKAQELKLCHRTPEQRFWRFVNKKSNNQCWDWIGSFGTTGYGQININKENILAHRFSYQLYFGKIPEELCVLHECDNPKCVNPDHLFLGNRKDNSNDRDNKNRQAKGEKNGSSKLTLNQIKYIRNLKNKFSQRKIAKMFGVGHATIGRIHRNEIWKHISNMEVKP